MGLVSWLRERAWQAGAPGRARKIRAAARSNRGRQTAPVATGAAASAAAGSKAGSEAATGALPAGEWEELSPYLPVDPAEHQTVCIVASALAAGDRPQSAFTVTGVSVANPEYRRVACIATALAAGALSTSQFSIKRIYKQKSTEGSHAA